MSFSTLESPMIPPSSTAPTSRGPSVGVPAVLRAPPGLLEGSSVVPVELLPVWSGADGVEADRSGRRRGITAMVTSSRALALASSQPA